MPSTPPSQRGPHPTNEVAAGHHGAATAYVEADSTTRGAARPARTSSALTCLARAAGQGGPPHSALARQRVAIPDLRPSGSGWLLEGQRPGPWSGQDSVRSHFHDGDRAPPHQPQTGGAGPLRCHRAPCSRFRRGPRDWTGQVGPATPAAELPPLREAALSALRDHDRPRNGSPPMRSAPATGDSARAHASLRLARAGSSSESGALSAKASPQRATRRHQSDWRRPTASSRIASP